jgi:hypothetical protein
MSNAAAPGRREKHAKPLTTGLQIFRRFYQPPVSRLKLNFLTSLATPGKISA